MKIRTNQLALWTCTTLLIMGIPASAQDAPSPATTAPTTADLPGDRMEPLPPELVGVGITEHLNATVPLDTQFVDENGRPVKLGDYFDRQHPVILTLNYYRCPMLCTLQLNGLVDALKELDWTAGDQFRIVTISFDPLETHQLAYLKQHSYIESYERPQAAAGWHFLTGRKPAIDTILDTTGFGVRWNEEQKQWMHVAALILCTPDGRISRYLYGVLYEPKTLRLSLVEASEGKIGTTVDRVLLFCYHYQDGQYAFAAMNFVRAGGGLSALAVAGLLWHLWRRERRGAGKAEATAE